MTVPPQEARTERPGRRSQAPWDDHRIIRAEVYSDELLNHHAVSLADAQVVVPTARPVVSLLKRMKDNHRALSESYRTVMAAIEAGETITPAAEWLVDNFHTLEEHIRQVRHDLPRSYFAELPKLGAGFLEGHPRIFGIMWAYVAHTDSLFDPDQLGVYIRSYESRKALTLGELWAVAINLRILLIENARRVAELVVHSGVGRRAADRVADLVLGVDGNPPRPLAKALPEWRTYTPSRAFYVQLVRRLAEAPEGREAVEWATERFTEQESASTHAVELEHQQQAGATLTMRNIFRSLRLLSDVNWEEWLEDVSLIEAELRTNDCYSRLDFATRNLYRSAIERLARGSGQREIDVTRLALSHAAATSDEVSSDVGYWLVDDGRAELERTVAFRPTARERLVRGVRRAGLAGYLAALAGGTFISLLVGMALILRFGPGVPWGWYVVLAVLLSVPLSELALGAINYRLSRLIPATILPSLDLDLGVPDELRTLVTIPTMITSADGVDDLLAQLEVHFLGNDNGELYFAAATDWADSDSEVTPADQALLDRAVAGIRALNARYGDRFLLFHRERRYNPAEGVWMGWERKRGKLAELNSLLRGAKDTSYVTVEGRRPGPFTYVITLDSDTMLPRTSALKLVAKLAHPLNRARFDARGRVFRGYSILQPRVTPALPMTEDTSAFQQVFSTTQGLDPYASAVSDAYQDLFAEGSFAGKGIYDIDALTRALDDRIPENAVLSHDLLEGNYSRSGLVTDVEVVEGYPTSYEVAVSRSHRWTRGDWQLLPWILYRHSGLSRLGLWKMTDNLRRSLVPVFWVLGVLVALAVLPPAGALTYLVVALMSLVLPFIVPLGQALPRAAAEVTVASQWRAFGHQARQGLAATAINLVLLSHQAALMADAIGRTLARLWSHRHLLEWTTAEAAGRHATGTLRGFVRLMAGGFAAPLVALAIGVLRGPMVLAIAAPLVVLWLLAPLVAQRLSRPLDRVELEAGPDEITELRTVARRTWHFFETFVTKDDHYLPPDNFQEVPDDRLAHRTSPTNIGLYLLATISARDFGWIGMGEATDRLEETLSTVRDLEHYQGHLFNWYDTRTLDPLPPRYVSSVDSGNLAGHLVTVANTCREWREAAPPIVVDPSGLQDTLRVLGEELEALPETDFPAPDRTTAGARLTEITHAVATLGTSEDPLEDLAHLQDLLVRLVQHSRLPHRLTVWANAVRSGVDSLGRDLVLDTAGHDQLRQRLARLEAYARQAFEEMSFRFLLDPKRRLLSVGFDVEDGTLDESCYDMLASECRLASYVAIAKGDIRTTHWFRLGRTVTAAGGGAVLLSWSGSMFEYLMPSLVMRSPADGLLNTTQLRVVARQIEYARELGVPWGISESGFNARDQQLNYQYSPFGVPGLGVVRGLADDLVISPYATGLAAMVQPDDAAANFRVLAEYGALGPYGYYEAIDFTKSRLLPGTDHAVVRSYMAHHSGMTIVAISNVVHDGLMRERFHVEPRVRATELLLQEPAPRLIPISNARREEISTTRTVRAVVRPSERALVGPAALAPAVHLMSNGRLSMVLTPAGGGHVLWRGSAITRWHADRTSDEAGDYLYFRDDDTGRVWSGAALPLRVQPTDYAVHFSEDGARYSRRDGFLTTTVSHFISPETDAAVRRVVIRNHDRRARRLTVTSYAELVLGRMADHDAHPVFSKMFVHTEYLPELGAILATRRRRSPEEPEVWAAHLLVTKRGAIGDPVAETDRRQFLGRGRTPRDPQRLAGDTGPGLTGYVLDPIFSLAQHVEIPPDGRATLSFWTAAASSREELLAVVDQLRSPGAYDRATALSWTQSQVQLRHLGITDDEAGHFQNLAGAVVYPTESRRSSAETLRAAGSQADLWPLGISGDLPILLVRIEDIADMEMVRQVLRAVEYWRLKRFSVDVVLLNEQSTSYAQDLQHELERHAAGLQTRTGSPDSTGTIYVVQADSAAPRTLATLLGTAAVVLLARRGDLTRQRAAGLPKPLPRALAALGARRERQSPPPPYPTGDLVLWNGYGGFTPDGREYVVVLDDASTPAPWTNVVANRQFGFQATAEGAGHTWWRNSRDNQLTPWHNDPVTAPVSEALYVRDEATGQVACPTASPVAGGRHVARHGFGYTTYEHTTSDSVDLRQTVFVAPEDPVKLSLLRIVNHSRRRKTFTVTSYAELALGSDTRSSSRHLVTSVDDDSGAFLVRNPWATQFTDQVVFFDMQGAQETWTGDRLEFLGVQGSTEMPSAIDDGLPLSGRVGAGPDPCAALQRTVEVDPGAAVELVVVLGAAHTTEEARSLVHRYRNTDPHRVLEAVRDQWQERLGSIQVSTPEAGFDLMVNGWLLYQTWTARMLARAGFYQLSGAYGYRDQLQDSMAIALVDPALTRGHLLRAAGRQFLEGDVQHWWLPETGAGIRTRISDDTIWLAYAVCHYVRLTGDAAVLDEQVPFLEGPLLEEDQTEDFFVPTTSTRTASLYEHCVAGLRHAFPHGQHGLPLMGTGDWNDGMNRVGVDGRGESVWLGWFLHTTLTGFCPLATRREDAPTLQEFRTEQQRLLRALETHGWDGEWYRRGYFDDGTPLGSAHRPECRIDGIAQSWAVLSGAAQPERAEQAMEQLQSQLVLPEDRLVRLFTPPFDVSEPDPGYIRAYPPGVRENGGQYTHGALWSIFAWSALGRTDRAATTFGMINPVNHARTRAEADTYRVEPYVVAADVYAAEPYVGRGGWTWYTGSAGWMYRAGLEAILGLHREGQHLALRPCLPPEWPRVSIRYRFGTSTYDIDIDTHGSDARRITRLTLDEADVPCPDDLARIPLVDDGNTHWVSLILSGKDEERG
ncbi:cyclic beta-1,2-glucan synthetase [Raineyella antarctica]|uniref:Cyclic beta-1,2-glucan synthetase n=1 Tax=Raineyella antarctica TaxID=1577474 RepID=A0A1G6GDF4_9ACTN|nr:glucoamylase family protein [Raineyella antarctica]SDB80027.1 cyclic beta-1,2-glucan synthetase [Raineyella antarctica]